MALSNTAVPKYYGEFRQKVLRGEIPVCQEISMGMNRIDAHIADPRYYYDPRPIEGFIAFCEGELTLTDGSPVEMLESFKLWAEDILCWYYFEELTVYSPELGRNVTRRVKRRLKQKQYLIVARGSAKSMYAEFLQAYILIMDSDTTAQITTAPTMKQADEVLAPFRTAISRAPGPLFQFLTMGTLQNTTGNTADRKKLAATKKGIENFMTNSTLEIRAMSVDKLQGLRPKITTIDEWLSGDTREDVVAAIEQGASKLDDWLIICISSEGTVRNAVGDTMKMELYQILRGQASADHISIWYYKLDDEKEIADPAMYRKANPNIGLTVGYSAYHKDVKRMEIAPDSRNDILAKRFGIPMEGHTFFFSYQETLVHNVNPRAFDGMACAMGADLSQGDDFCAFTFLFPLADGRFGVKTRSYITDLTLKRLPGATRAKYEEFRVEDSLHIMEGVTLHMPDVYEDLFRHITSRNYDLRTMGYDPYNSMEFLELYKRDFGPFCIEKVIQGAKTESVPLGELKNLAEERMLIFGEALMSYGMGNAVVEKDTNNNKKLVKNRRDKKIDNVSAMMDAYVAWKANKEAF